MATQCLLYQIKSNYSQYLGTEVNSASEYEIQYSVLRAVSYSFSADKTITCPRLRGAGATRVESPSCELKAKFAGIGTTFCLLLPTQSRLCRNL